MPIILTYTQLFEFQLTKKSRNFLEKLSDVLAFTLGLDMT
ncbi:hypothetical protein RV01_GL000047 [Enterococcus dispar]|nr:hypothetical protein RV01_GL000047 [Enterococcus dispar]